MKGKVDLFGDLDNLINMPARYVLFARMKRRVQAEMLVNEEGGRK